MERIMPFKLCLFAILLSLYSLAHAAEKESLPIDLIELLGELDGDDQDKNGQDTLEAAMADVQAPKSSSKETGKQTNEQKRKTEVGGQK
jgi:hypothetical protein